MGKTSVEIPTEMIVVTNSGPLMIIQRNDIWIAEDLCRSVFERLKNSS